MTALGRAGAPAIAVVGSLNLDIVVPVRSLPRPGETVLGGYARRGCGGKGANQAVAAARLGQSVAMIGRVGDDEPGRVLRDALATERVDVSRVAVTRDAPTGVALIAVDESGENTIVVSPGANERLSSKDVGDAARCLEQAGALLVQLEVPLAAVAAAVAASSGIVILNPAPAAVLEEGLLASVDVLVPNRSELARLAGKEETTDLASLRAMAAGLAGPGAVVVTLGANGALVVEERGAIHIPPTPVEAVDATGAGDCFCGALADGLVRGLSLVEAAEWASRAAAVAITKPGAQGSLPRRAEVAAL